MDDDAEMDALEEAKAAHRVAFANWEAAYTGWRDAACDEHQEAEERLWWGNHVVAAREDLLQCRARLKRAVEASGQTWERYLHPETCVSRFRRKIIALFH